MNIFFPLYLLPFHLFFCWVVCSSYIECLPVARLGSRHPHIFWDKREIIFQVMWERVQSHDDEEEEDSSYVRITASRSSTTDDVFDFRGQEEEEPTTTRTTTSQLPLGNISMNHTQRWLEESNFFRHHHSSSCQTPQMGDTEKKIAENKNSTLPPVVAVVESQDSADMIIPAAAANVQKKKTDTPLTVSPRGVNDFDTGFLAFFEGDDDINNDYFSSESNPFRISSSKDSSNDKFIPTKEWEDHPAPMMSVQEDVTPKKRNGRKGSVDVISPPTTASQDPVHLERTFAATSTTTMEPMIPFSTKETLAMTATSPTTVVTTVVTDLGDDSDRYDDPPCPLVAPLTTPTTPARTTAMVSSTSSSSSTVPSSPESSSSSSLRPLRSDPLIKVGGRIPAKLRLYIDEYQSDFFQFLLQELLEDEAKKNILKLDIHRSNTTTAMDGNIRTLKEMEDFFHMVQSLPELKILFLSNLHGGEKDLSALDRTLRGHTSLTSIYLQMASDGIPFSLNTLRTLQSMPRLKEVTLESCHHSSFDPSPLFRSTTIRKLHIRSSSMKSHRFEDTHIFAIIPLLEANSTLLELDLEPKISILAFKFLIRALRVNQSLQQLRVAIDTTSSQTLIHQAMSEVATVIATNSTLRILKNTEYKNLNVEGPCSRWILRGLEANVKMEHFHLFQETPSFTSRKRELVKPTCNNLSVVRLDGPPGSASSANTSFNGRRRNPMVCGSSIVPCSEASCTSAVTESDSSHTSTATTTIFCSGMMDFWTIEPVTGASETVWKNAMGYGERALAYLTSGFTTTTTTTTTAATTTTTSPGRRRGKTGRNDRAATGSARPSSALR